MEDFSNNPLDIHLLPKFEEVNYTPVSDKYLIKSHAQTGIFLLVVLLGWGAFWYFDADARQLQIAGLGIFLFFGFRFWNNYKMQRNYGYALREKDVLYRRGFLVHSVTVIPFNRIQHVSVSRDFIDKMLDISSLQIYTAGGSGSDINIPGLKPALAANLKDALSSRLTAHDH